LSDLLSIAGAAAPSTPAKGLRVLFVNRLLTGECIGRVPLGIMYLSSALKQRGHAVDIADANDHHALGHKVREFQPDAVLYSVRTGYHKGYMKVNRQLKERFPHLISIFGGNHPTFYPQMILNEQAIDAVCIGEGEAAIVEFMDRLGRRGNYEETPNFWVRRDDQIFKNKPGRLIEPMDAIPFPDRDLLNAFPMVRTFPVRNFITTRGCPYDCTYCFNYAYYNNIYKGLGKRVRRRTVENVMQEIEAEYRAHPFQAAQFEDDIFVYDTHWIREFGQQFSKRIGKPFTCNVRVELMDEERSRLLKEAGCVSVWLGVEAGDETIRKDLLGRSNNDNVTFRGIRNLQKQGIHVSTENILGLPKTNVAHDFKTLDLNLQLRPSFANPSVFQPYPQTPLGDTAREAGVFSGNYDDIPDFYEGSCLAVKHLQEIVNLQYLFSLTVEFPWLRRFVPTLVKLPFGELYKRLMLLYKGYVLTHRIVPMKMSFKEMAHVARRAFGVEHVVEF